MFEIVGQARCSLRYTQIVPKWHLDGQLAGTDFFNTRGRRDAHKKFPFLPGANSDGFGLLRNGGKHMFEITGQGWVFPAIYPNSAKMVVGWATVRNFIFQHASAARPAKKFSVFAGSEFGWIQIA